MVRSCAHNDVTCVGAHHDSWNCAFSLEDHLFLARDSKLARKLLLTEKNCFLKISPQSIRELLIRTEIKLFFLEFGVKICENVWSTTWKGWHFEEDHGRPKGLDQRGRMGRFGPGSLPPINGLFPCFACSGLKFGQSRQNQQFQFRSHWEQRVLKLSDATRIWP